MVRTTRKQREMLKQRWQLMVEWEEADRNPRPPYREFRKCVQATYGMDGAIVVPWCGMWLVIEGDGYAHS